MGVISRRSKFDTVSAHAQSVVVKHFRKMTKSKVVPKKKFARTGGAGPAEGNVNTMVVNGSANNIEIEGLMKYTNYTVFVWANTSVGGGDRSESVTFEDSELNVYCSCIDALVPVDASVTCILKDK